MVFFRLKFEKRLAEMPLYLDASYSILEFDGAIQVNHYGLFAKPIHSPL
jgi:hypothetical protein